MLSWHLRHSFRRLRVSRSLAPVIGSDGQQDRSLSSSGRGGGSGKKGNFDERFLKPAAKGRLAAGHEAGIPRLSARRHKARLQPPAPRRFDEDGDEEDNEWLEDTEGRLRLPLFASSSSSLSSPPSSRDFDFVGGGGGDYYAEQLLDDSGRYYWREEEYERLTVDDVDGALVNEDGVVEIEYGKDDMILGGESFMKALMAEDDEEPGYDLADEGEDQPRRGRSFEAWEEKDPEKQFFFEQNDVFELAALGEEQFQDTTGPDYTVLPLRPHGPDLDDFLEAMAEHPSAYAHLSSPKQHPESMREPKPVFPSYRAHPPLEFVESYARFLYVDGLPPIEGDLGEEGDLNNPVHRSLIQKTIARLVGVDSDRVFPATTTSGFVGFASPKALAQALAAGPTEPVMTSVPLITMFDGDAGDWKDAADSLVHLSNIPPSQTPRMLVRKLFPEGSEVAAVYGNVKPEDIRFDSSTSVIIRFASKEQAESAVVSSLINEQLSELGQYSIRYFRARRELVHAGFTGPSKRREKRRMGPRLIVDGDMPSKDFYLSHARVLQLRNLDTSLSKQEISDAFQPYCARTRDVNGSIELVTDEAGLPTGHAYVGFDIPGEAEAAIEALKGRIELGDQKSTFKLVHDRQIPGRPKLQVEKRPERSADELLDDLDNWEKCVDPEDIKLLEAAGISKVVLGEALRGIRYNNATFGAFDSAVRSEALQPEKMQGELYRELVEMYISTLKECLATPENVGPMYEALHFPGEAVDLSIFDTEKQRQAELLNKRVSGS